MIKKKKKRNSVSAGLFCSDPDVFFLFCRVLVYTGHTDARQTESHIHLEEISTKLLEAKKKMITPITHSFYTQLRTSGVFLLQKLTWCSHIFFHTNEYI